MEICGGASFFRSRGIERIFRDIQGVRFDPWDERRQYVFSGASPWGSIRSSAGLRGRTINLRARARMTHRVPPRNELSLQQREHDIVEPVRTALSSSGVLDCHREMRRPFGDPCDLASGPQSARKKASMTPSSELFFSPAQARTASV